VLTCLRTGLFHPPLAPFLSSFAEVSTHGLVIFCGSNVALGYFMTALTLLTPANDALTAQTRKSPLLRITLTQINVSTPDPSFLDALLVNFVWPTQHRGIQCCVVQLVCRECPDERIRQLRIRSTTDFLRHTSSPVSDHSNLPSLATTSVC
jgi:hypothetical protein